MQLHILRHGQTDLNRERRYQGSMDPPLNTLGIDQARRAASLLPESIDVLVSSPMRRALQTAEIISRHSGVPVRVMPEFRERAFGVFEGLSKPEVKNLFPDLWKRRPLRSFDAAPPEGEAVGEVLERVRRGIDELLAQCPRGQVVVVAHAFIARAIRGLATSPPRDGFFDYSLANGACASYTINDTPDTAFQQPLCRTS